jgi:DNA-binding NarL/FixJ family response regulator
MPKEKISIMLAEDHVVVREGIRQFLERVEDFRVVGECGDGEQTVEMAAQLKPDVIIMDIAMPKLNGIEATKKIKSFHPSVAILVLSAYDYDEYIFALLEAGAAGYLLKDVSGRELVNAIYAVHEGESVLHPVIAHKVVEQFRGVATKPAEEQVSSVLSKREIDVLKMAAKGMSNKEIAEELFLSVHTVEAHLRNIFNTLGVGSRIEAVIHALRKGWFNLEDLS